MTETAGMRLDAAVPLLFPGYSRSFGEKLIQAGEILVNGQVKKANYKLKEEDRVSCTHVDAENILLPESIPLDIIYEDDDVLVLNKPKHLVVHPAGGHRSGTLVNALLHYTDQLSTLGGDDRPGIVHRLDKDTEGLLLVAKNDQAHTFLTDQLSDKTMNRQYLCLAKGKMNNQPFTVEAPIGRHPGNRKKMAVRPDGRYAKTTFRPVAVSEQYTLLDCRLDTGRTHQIRVHLASVGHSILGDQTYGRPSKIKADTQALYAYRLSFIHPSTQKRITITLPPPEEFVRLCGKAGVSIPQVYFEGGIVFGTDTEIS